MDVLENQSIAEEHDSMWLKRAQPLRVGSLRFSLLPEEFGVISYA